MKSSSIRHEFVDSIPEELEQGVLYITIRYRTAAHLCACGCGLKVVTPIKPKRWVLFFDGETVSLWPSIGRWQLPCRSHYVIENDRIRWARPWTNEGIESGRYQDELDVRTYFASRISESQMPDELEAAATRTRPNPISRAWSKVRALPRISRAARNL